MLDTDPEDGGTEGEFRRAASRFATEIAGRLTGKSRASSPTGSGPRSRRSRIARRVGSPSASICG